MSNSRQTCYRITLFLICSILLTLIFIPTHSSAANSLEQDSPPEDSSETLFDPTTDVEPMPLPEWTPPKEIPGFVNQVTAYNTETGEETLYPVPTETRSDSQSTLPYQPDWFSTALDLDRSFGSLTAVSNPEVWPYSPIVKIFTVYPSGAVTACSGTIVDSEHVITAGHCVYTHTSEFCGSSATSCWASAVYVFSGYDDGNYTFASKAASGGLLSWTAYTISEDLDWDIAGIELEYPIGGATGWFAYGYNNTDSYFTSNTFTSTGFPGAAPYDGATMYTFSGTFDYVYTEQLAHANYGIGGQSGSGAYDSGYIVYGVLSHGSVAPDPAYLAHTRITSAKYSGFQNWFADNKNHLFDLALYGVSVSPTSYDRGDQLTNLEYYLFNVSSASQPSDLYFIDFYLSENSNISGSDTFLQRRNGTWSFDANTGRHITATSNLPTIPDDLCVSGTDGATYYIGAILDESDYYAGNNETDGYQVAEIWINACDPYEPDDTYSSASTLTTPFDEQVHDIIPMDDEDWVTFTLTEESSIELETWGASGDTVLFLLDSDRIEIESNDDGGTALFSFIDRTCAVDPLPAGTYYAQIISYDNDEKINDYSLTLLSSPCSGAGNTYLPLIIR